VDSTVRIFGLLITASSALLLVFAIWSLVVTPEGYQLVLPPEEHSAWLSRWEYYGAFLALSSGVALCAGVGIFRQKMWALLVFAGVSTFLAAHDYVRAATGKAIYGFEQPSAVEAVVFLLLGALSVMLFIRKPAKDPLT
jgi:hypothetical protein